MTDSPTPAQQAEASSPPSAEIWDKLAVVVLAGDRAVFSIDADGNLQVPATYVLRSEVGVALARATAALAA